MARPDATGRPRQGAPGACSQRPAAVACLLAIVWLAAAAVAGGAKTELTPLQLAARVAASYREARLKLAERWEHDPALLCKSAAVHGVMQKRFGGSNNPTMHMDTEMADVFAFNRVPLYAPTQFFVSRKYKFVYVRQPKSSSSAIIDAITKTFCARPKCSSFELQAASKLTDRLWRIYFVFTWIRNPLTRLPSAYNMMVSRYLFLRAGANGTAVGDHCSIPLLNFSQDANALRADCQARGCCVFIPEYKQWIPWFIAAHINDQSHAVFIDAGSSMVDFIGRTEHIEDDWALFMKHYNKRFHTRFKTIRMSVVNPTEEPASKARSVRAAPADEPCHGFAALNATLNETVMHNFALQYSRDMLLFGFL